MNGLPDIPPKIFTLSATAVGYILLDSLASTEQNALGNWFMLVGQILCTNGSYQFHGETKKGQNNYNNSTINMLKQTVNAIQKEIEELKKYNL